MRTSSKLTMHQSCRYNYMNPMTSRRPSCQINVARGGVKDGVGVSGVHPRHRHTRHSNSTLSKSATEKGGQDDLFRLFFHPCAALYTPEVMKARICFFGQYPKLGDLSRPTIATTAKQDILELPKSNSIKSSVSISRQPCWQV
jgi:hypothetical protein